MSTERASAHDRITASVFAVQWMVNRLHSLQSGMERAGRLDSPMASTFATEAVRHGDLLEDVAQKLADLVDAIADHCNGCDFVSEEDVAMLTPVFRLIRPEAPHA